MTSLRNEISAAVVELWKVKFQATIVMRNIRRNFKRKSKNNYLFPGYDLLNRSVLYSG